MLPASNRGAGSALNFPDVCKTPAPPLPFIPVPYPDIGLNMQAAPFSPNVMVGFMPATNMGTMKVMTNGDEAGAMGGMLTGAIKGPGRTTMGNPTVLVSGLPAESLLSPTSGNNMNAPLGAQLVPSVVNVLYSFREGPVSGGAPNSESATLPSLELSELRALGDVTRGQGDAEAAAQVVASWLAPGVALVRLALFSSHADSALFNALSTLDGEALRGVVLDLRGNPGGESAAALRLAAAWLPRGTVVLRERELDGDEEPVVARGEPSYAIPLCILIDGFSASAAELVAASLQYHGRASVIGRPSYGKATAQRALGCSDGATRYATVAEYVLPNGAPIHGRGVLPDVLVEAAPADALVRTWDDPDCRAALRVLEAT